METIDFKIGRITLMERFCPCTPKKPVADKKHLQGFMKIFKEKLECVACTAEIEIGIMYQLGEKELFICEMCFRHVQKIGVQAIELQYDNQGRICHDG
jgi:hypothetical protein